MKCPDILAHLDEALDGRGKPAYLPDGVRRHLGECASCRAEWEVLQRAEEALEAAAADDGVADGLNAGDDSPAGLHQRIMRAVAAELEQITTRARERAQEADLLRFGLEEIAAVEPRAGEDAELAEEAERLGHAEALASAAAVAHAALAGNPEDPEGVDAGTLVAGAQRALEAVRAHDPALADRLARAHRRGE